MMKKFKKLVLLGIGEQLLASEYWKQLGALTEKIVHISKDDKREFRERELADADGLLVNQFVIPAPKDIIASAPNLKYIGVFSTAYGKVDFEYANKKGVVVCNIPGFSTEAVSEFAFGVILEYIRDIERCKQLAREGDFSGVPKFPLYEIKGKTFGVIGLGRIGMRIAELAQAFGADVCYWSRHRRKDAEARGIKYSDVDKLISECNFLSTNLALTKDTENFMNAARIAKIKSGSVFINLSANELIDFDALKKRLAKNDMVYIADHSDEMSPELVKSLQAFKNCILYPPLAFATNEARVLKQEMLISNAENFLKGKPTNIVN